MRRYVIVGTLLALSGLVLARLTAACCGPGTPVVPGTTTGPGPAASPKAVSELVAILDKTDSKDTFLLTVMVLHKMGPDAREALPALIRNAERLGLVKGIARAMSRKGKDEAGTKVSAVTETICEAMLDIASGATAWREASAPVSCQAPASAPVYSPAPTVAPQVVPANPPPGVPVPPPAPGSAPTVPATPAPGVPAANAIMGFVR